MSAPTPAIGWKAHAALARAGGQWTELPGFAGSTYRLAGGEPIWIGEAVAAMHPRAVVVAAAAARALQPLAIDNLVPWRIAPLRLGARAAGALRASGIALAASLRVLGAPRGFAAIVAGVQPVFPLHAVLPDVVALARALDRDDARAFAVAARALIGLGEGLTPSGDDFVGAALYARGLSAFGEAWTATMRELVLAARLRTHAVGAALFADLVEGQSFDALHHLAEAMAATAPAQHPATNAATEPSRVRAAAREVAAIGQSSGWDMLAGFVIGCAGSAALPHTVFAAADGRRTEPWKEGA